MGNSSPLLETLARKSRLTVMCLMSEEDAVTTPELSAQAACKNIKKAERRIWLYVLIQCVRATTGWKGVTEEEV